MIGRANPARNRRRIVAIAALTAFIALNVWLYLRVGLPMTCYVRDTARMRAFMADKGWATDFIFAGLVCFQVIVAIIPGEPLELCAGYLFGPLAGTLICLAGITAGSAAVFGLTRLFGRRFAALFISERKLASLRFLHNERRLYTAMAGMMLVPGTPKDVLTYFAGLTPVSFRAWLVMCSIGRLPSIVSSTWGASAIAEGDYVRAAVIFAVTAILCALGLLLFRRLREKHCHSTDRE